MKLSRIGSLLLSVLIVLSLVACESSQIRSVQADEGAVTIDFWTLWESESSNNAIIEKIIDDYNNSQDEVIVNHTAFPKGKMWTQNTVSIATGNPADVIINDMQSVVYRATHNQVTDISKYITDEYKEMFYPHLWEAVESEKKTYAIPFITNTNVLFYNKAAYEEVGLDPNSPPSTWKELEEYATRLDRKQGDQYEHIGFHPLWGGLGSISWMINADDGQAFIQDGELNIYTEKKIEGLLWLKNWRDKYGANPVDKLSIDFMEDHSNPFLAEKVAMWVDNGTLYSSIRDEGTSTDIGVAPIPAYNDFTENWSTGEGLVVEIPRGAKNPDEAMDFIKYLTSAEVQKYWASQTFDIAANKVGAELALAEFNEKDAEVYSFMLENLAVTKIIPTPVEYPGYQKKVNLMIDHVMINNVSPEQALKRAEEIVKN